MYPSKRDLSKKIRALQDELQRKVEEIAHHEAMARQQSHQVAHLKVDPPGAYLESARRVVPFKYWSDRELLECLHRLEIVRLTSTHGIAPDGTDYRRPVGIPLPLGDALLREVNRRALRLAECGVTAGGDRA